MARVWQSRTYRPNGWTRILFVVDSDAALVDYLTQVKRYAGQVPARRRALLSQARAGHLDARQRYIDCLLHEAATISLRERPSWMPELDAVQEANLVLVRLVDNPEVADPQREIQAAVRAHFSSLSETPAFPNPAG